MPRTWNKKKKEFNFIDLHLRRRKDRTDITRFESFEEIGEIIADVVKKYDNVTCISGRNFIPEDETLFSDLYLHPNDAGFKYYSESVKKAIEV